MRLLNADYKMGTEVTGLKQQVVDHKCEFRARYLKGEATYLPIFRGWFGLGKGCSDETSQC